MVGTPEEFQGNERDIVFITLGLAGSETRVNQWEERRRFNVATSRAINYAFLIYGGIPKNARLLKSYLTHFGKSWRSQQEGESNEVESKPTVLRYRWDWNRKLHRELCESEFEHRVADFLEQFVEQHGGAKRIRLFNQVQASRELGVSSCGQKRLDFVLLNAVNGSCVAVEVDGRDHFTADGRSYSEAHLERVEILRRAGWEIVHVPYYRWWRNAWLSESNDPKFQKTISDFFSELKFALGLA
jgi:very-short-patch-repair endonuclease